MNFQIEFRGTGSYLPEKVISNFDLAKRFKIKESDIVKKTGISERRWASKKEAVSDLATCASVKALSRAGIDPSELDLIILSSTFPDRLFPSSACLLQMNLKTRKIPAFDIQASCSGFLYGLSIAEHFLRQTAFQNVLVAASEIKSRMLDPDDSATSILFGDGAGAVILSKTRKKHGILSLHLHSDGSKHDYIMLPGGGSRIPASKKSCEEGLHWIKMKGPSVFRSAVHYFGKAIQEALDINKIEIGQIAHFIFHQANLRLLERIIEKYKIPKEKVELTIHKYGNTSSASLPITFDHAVSNKKFKRGDLVMFASFGGGITWASLIYKW
ncbi:MAG: 3-oxoacyl-ACP synthase III family protein [Nitrospiria bacterium]